MKRLTALLLVVFIITGGVFQTCFAAGSKVDSASVKKLTDCLAKTQKVDSMETNTVTKTKSGGQSMDISMNMKIENIKKGLKSVVKTSYLSQKQQFYLSVSGGKATVYMKDPATGKYKSKAADSSQIGDLDVTKTFKSYINVLKKNPGLLQKVANNRFRLNIPKNKTSAFYKEITGKTLGYKIDSLLVEFVVGKDGYLQNVDLKLSYNKITTASYTKYSNYNKKFNIVLPKVS